MELLKEVLICNSIRNWTDFSADLTLIFDSWFALIARARVDSLAFPHLLSIDDLAVFRVRVHQVVILDPSKVAQVVNVIAFLLEERIELGTLELVVPRFVFLHKLTEVHFVLKHVEIFHRPTEGNTVDSVLFSICCQLFTLYLAIDLVL